MVKGEDLDKEVKACVLAVTALLMPVEEEKEKVEEEEEEE